ncbi:MAG: GvpL/GvpF family gas vesicle protein [Chloroflexi bacterium]|nr:GvpL/GvpF family gas vesicle protein [Chloroflexota bacterium]
MIYIYGIAENGGALPAGVTGIDDAPPYLLDDADISAIVSTVPSQRIPLSESNMWRHEKLIECCMDGRAVLPACYGTVLDDAPAVLAVLATNHADFASNLKCVRGKVELSVRVLWEDASAAVATQTLSATPETLSATPENVADDKTRHGLAYMMARLQTDREQRARRQRGQIYVDQIDATLAKIAVLHTQKTFVTPGLLLTAAYLVEREHLAHFRAALETLAATQPNLRFLCTGPWPPYSFVTVKIRLPESHSRSLKDSGSVTPAH